MTDNDDPSANPEKESRGAHDKSTNFESKQIVLVNALKDPAMFNDGAVEHIETHLSHVFLTDSNVYKLKRAKALDFVDYSTVEKRRFYCERELAANAHWVDELYEGVVPVRKTGDSFSISADKGEIVDWLVHMRRFPDNARLDRRLKAGAVTDAELTQFADDLFATHSQAETQTKYGGYPQIAGLIRQITYDLRETKIGTSLAEKIGAWHDVLTKRTKQHAEYLNQRRQNGKVRTCHGDLHLKNICYWNNRLVGFDALEFDEGMCTIDVLYDLAFTVMDLIHAGRNDAANLVLNSYLGRSEDYEGLIVFDLFLSLRAGVRAMAAALAGDIENAKKYFDTARMLITDRPPSKLIVIGGRSGSGKSTIAKALAPKIGYAPGAITIRSDVLRKTRLGVTPEERLTKDAYTPRQSRAVYGDLNKNATKVLSAGYACILDATFLEQYARELLADLAATSDVEHHFLWLNAPPNCLHDRLETRGKDASDADHRVLDTQLKRRAPSDWIIIDASGSIASTRDSALGHIGHGTHIYTPRALNPAHDV